MSRKMCGFRTSRGFGMNVSVYQHSYKSDDHLKPWYEDIHSFSDLWNFILNKRRKK